MPGPRPSFPPLEDDPLGLDIGAAKRRPARPVRVEILRELGAEDLPILQSEEAAPVKGQTLRNLRHSHHNLAMLIAKGDPIEQVALSTGYDPQYIARLARSDPAFKELVAHYVSIREEKFVDVMDRMKVLGLSTLDEIQNRLEAAPDDWSRRELMELADLMLLKPIAVQQRANGTGFAAGSAAPVNVAVNFVTAPTKALPEPITIDAEPNK